MDTGAGIHLQEGQKNKKFFLKFEKVNMKICINKC